MGVKNYSIFDKFQSHVNPGILDNIRAFLEAEEAVSEYRVEADSGNKIFVNMMLEKFSYLAARSIFLNLTEFMRCSYFNIYACEEMGERVRYLFLTGLHGKDGISMEIMIG